jgi:hypothetical protein
LGQKINVSRGFLHKKWSKSSQNWSKLAKFGENGQKWSKIIIIIIEKEKKKKKKKRRK